MILPRFSPGAVMVEIDDQIEAASQDLAEGFVWLANGGDRPAGDVPQVALLAQGLREFLVAIRMIAENG